jgi:hypothetical protein
MYLPLSHLNSISFSLQGGILFGILGLDSRTPAQTPVRDPSIPRRLKRHPPNAPSHPSDRRPKSGKDLLVELFRQTKRQSPHTAREFYNFLRRITPEFRSFTGPQLERLRDGKLRKVLEKFKSLETPIFNKKLQVAQERGMKIGNRCQ